MILGDRLMNNTFLSIVIILLLNSFLISQEQNDEKNSVIGHGWDEPSPVGGYESILKNLVYPEEAKKAGIEGKVVIKAFIDSTGKVTETVVVKGFPDTGLDQAAIEALKKTRWNPAIKEGKLIGVWVTIPLNFCLDSPFPPPLSQLSEEEKTKFVPYDEPPRPIGGYSVIQKNIIYPGIPNTGLDEAAMEAVRNTRFKPALKKGEPVGVWISIPINFRLTRHTSTKRSLRSILLGVAVVVLLLQVF